MNTITYAEQLHALSSQDERIVIMTAENRAPLRGLPLVGNRHFIDVGIAEQTLVGMAAGLALRGRIPVVHALAAFLTMRAYEFIRTDVGIPSLPVKFVGYIPGILSDGNGPTHQAVEDIALMRQIPGMNIFCPADHDELVKALPEIISTPGPAYVRYIADNAHIEHNTSFACGKAEVFGEGTELTILTYGYLVREALEAARILELKGLSTAVVNLRTLSPIDEQVLHAKLDQRSLIVTLEDHRPIGGLYSIVAEYCLKRGIAANVLSIGFPDGRFIPGRLDEVLCVHGMTGEAIARHILRHVHNEHFVLSELSPLPSLA